MFDHDTRNYKSTSQCDAINQIRVQASVTQKKLKRSVCLNTSYQCAGYQLAFDSNTHQSKVRHSGDYQPIADGLVTSTVRVTELCFQFNEPLQNIMAINQCLQINMMIRITWQAIEIFKQDTVPQDIGFFITDIWRPLLRTEGSPLPPFQGFQSTLPPVSRLHTTTDWRIFYIQSPQPNPDWGISYILSQPPSLPLFLLTTDSVQWAHTPLPPLQGSQSHQFPVGTLQRTNPPALILKSSRDPPAVY